MTIHLYGIANCDTVRKARAWLESKGLGAVFHDYKKEGVDPDKLAKWCAVLGWENLLNRSGTAFRKLDDDRKANLDEDKAIALMLAFPSTIKRPVVEYPSGLLLGFKPDRWEATLA